MLKKIKYWTYQEVLDLIESWPYSEGIPNGKTPVASWLKNLLSEANMAYNIIGLNSAITSTIADAIVDSLMQIVYNRHSNDYIYSVRMGFEQSHDLDADDMTRIFTKLVNVLNNTAPKYIPMFQAVQSNTDNLVKKAESSASSDTRFNDTPQNTGGYEDLSHATTTTHFSSTASADTGSIMDRLASMFSNFRAVILDWSNEFNQIFLNEAQIEWRDYYED